MSARPNRDPDRPMMEYLPRMYRTKIISGARFIEGTTTPTLIRYDEVRFTVHNHHSIGSSITRSMLYSGAPGALQDNGSSILQRGGLQGGGSSILQRGHYIRFVLNNQLKNKV